MGDTHNRTPEVGTETQLLIDDHVVDEIWLIRRAPEMPVKYLNSPVFDEVWGNTIIYDEEERIFKMWYGIPIPGTYEARGAYAVSDDGIQWEKPDMGLVEYEGSMKNNLIGTNGFGSILKDHWDPDPQRKYKMMTKRKSTEVSEGRAFAAFSADGIHWQDHPGEKAIVRGSGDGNGMVLYDETIRKYVNFRRPTIRAGGGVHTGDIGFPDGHVMKGAGGDNRSAPEGIGFPLEDDFVLHEEAEDYIHRYLRPAPYIDTRALRIYKEKGEEERGASLRCNRRVARAESEDFLNWTEPEVILRPDELDPPKFYSMSVAKYCGMYLGLVQVYNAWGFRRYPGCPQESETIDIHLTFSRDGWHWERLANRPVFIPRGYIGSFEGGMICQSNPPLIEYGDEIRFYFQGRAGSHNAPSRDGGIGLARLPKERIVARTAGDEVGALLTKPFELTGKQLAVNANASKGLIKVEVTDPIGKPIEGFSGGEAEEIRGNESRHPVAWKGGRKLEEIAGQTIRLRFFMLQSKLYSFKFN